MTDLSVLIPARNERFLSNTIQDILEHAHADTEVIAVLDGQWADPPIVDDPKVTLIYHSESIGQRAAINEAARAARGTWLMKVDAHCAFDDGFDVKMLDVIEPDWTMVPVMRNLHAFDWVCPNGHRRYQGPSGPCHECGEPTEMDIMWIPKTNPQSYAYCFDSEPHFRYFNEFRRRPEGAGPLSETMSLQGSCFMLSKERYFALNVCDEKWGSWGSQGIEVACKTWLSGGRVIVNHSTWYAHMFRTQGGDFGFPYHLSGRQVEHAKKVARDTFYNNEWPLQVRPLSWLLERFWPVPGWTPQQLDALKFLTPDNLKHEERSTSEPNVPSETIERDRYRIGPSIPSPLLTAGIVYYTDNCLDPHIMKACQNTLVRAAGDIPIVSVSLQPLGFAQNICLPLERGYLTMFKQILTGLEALDTDYVFLCEHDILYHSTHFDFVPPVPDVYFYNINTWKVDAVTGHALTYITKQTSGLCASRVLLLKHYRERVRRVEAEGFSRKMGFEPGSHGRAERVDNYGSDVWHSEWPNIDIRHSTNLTPSRWRQDQFRDQRNCKGWREAESVEGWYEVGKFAELLERASLQ